MTKYLINFDGSIEIEANNPDEALEIFQNMSNDEVGKYIDSAEVDNYE